MFYRSIFVDKRWTNHGMLIVEDRPWWTFFNEIKNRLLSVNGKGLGGLGSSFFYQLRYEARRADISGFRGKMDYICWQSKRVWSFHPKWLGKKGLMDKFGEFLIINLWPGPLFAFIKETMRGSQKISYASLYFNQLILPFIFTRFRHSCSVSTIRFSVRLLLV